MMLHCSPIRTALHFLCMDNAEKPSQLECSRNLKESTQDQNAISFHAAQPAQECGNGLACHSENHQLFVSLTLDAQELWGLERLLKHCADTLAHTQAVAYGGMKINQEVQQSKCSEKLVIFMFDHGHV